MDGKFIFVKIKSFNKNVTSRSLDIQNKLIKRNATTCMEQQLINQPAV